MHYKTVCCLSLDGFFLCPSYINERELNCSLKVREYARNLRSSIDKNSASQMKQTLLYNGIVSIKKIRNGIKIDFDESEGKK